LLDPVGERRIRDETQVNRRRVFCALDVDLVSAEAERGAAAPERLDLHAEHTPVERARPVHVADSQGEMVEAVEIEVWHASDPIPYQRSPGRSVRAWPPLVEPSRVQLDHVAVGDRMGSADVLSVESTLAPHARVPERPR